VGKGAYSRLLSETVFNISNLDLSVLKIYLEYLRDFACSRLSGRPDLSSESFFWAQSYRALRKKGQAVYGEYRENHCKKSISYALGKLRKRFTEPLKLVEVGCGPTSQFYTEDIANQSDLEIITVDPLASHYAKLHQQYKTPYDIKCVEGYGETLDRLFKEETFHLVYSQNAIDHSISPQLFVDNLFRILKIGGYLILYGFIREGSNSGWLGLHKWDIEAENNDLLLTNRSRSVYRKSLTRHLKLTLVSSEIINQTEYTHIYEKTARF
jgi:ubiquinone/menaquinone biosynthesis C-methylase UbiE